jgi:hypothetical protein
MHRTTILLPEDLYQAAGQEARAQGVSLGELIRRRLASITPRESPGETFFTRSPWTGEAPSDLSSNHDRYLYGS